MYVVFMNRPNYPSVIGEYDSLDMAQEAARREQGAESDIGGRHDAAIYIAEAISKREFKTHY